jgi:hypothetical protein
MRLQRKPYLLDSLKAIGHDSTFMSTPPDFLDNTQECMLEFQLNYTISFPSGEIG